MRKIYSVKFKKFGFFAFVLGLLFCFGSFGLQAQNKVTGISVPATQTGVANYGTSSSVSYEVTVTSDGAATAGSTTLSLNWGTTPAGVSFSPTTVTIPSGNTSTHVTLIITSAANTDAGNYSFTVTSSDGPHTSSPASSFIVDRATLTVSATADDKVYDGNTTATVSLSSDKLSGDVVTINNTAANFNTAAVGANKPVTVTGISISGADAANYTLASTTASTTANITTKTLNVTATASNKVYDGNTTATVSLSSDKLSGDVVTINNTAANFNTAAVGANKPVTVTGISISGADAANYTLASTTASTTANITVKTLTVTATASDKVYDGITTAAVTLSGNQLTGDVVNITYTSATFSDANVGSNKTVTVSGITISGSDAGNYTLVSITATDKADITAAPTSVVVASNSSPVCLNTPVTFTATITSVPSGATGTVTFFDGGAPMGSATVSSTTATLTIATLTAGTHSIKATFASSNSNYAGSTSVGINQIINPLPTISLGSLPDFCPGSTSFNLVYTVTTGSPTTYSISAGSPAFPGFAPVVDATLTGSPLTISLPSAAPAGTYQFIISVKNANGCVSTVKSFSVTFLDNTKPNISSPGDILVQANDGCTATGVDLGTASVSDFCSTVVPVTVTNDAPTAFPIGVTTVTWTATDGSGNTNTATQKVTVVDQTPPVAIGKNITVYLDATGNATITAADINDGSSDNCGLPVLTLSKSNFDCSNIGANSVQLIATDASGNQSSYTSTVTVVDNIAPAPITKNITVYLNAAGAVTIAAADINNGSTDNCGIKSLTIDKSTFDCSNVGVNTVTLTVTDNSGNLNTATATVTVVDNTPPVSNCKPATLYLDPGTGTVTLKVSDISNGLSDNCSPLTRSLSQKNFTCDDVGSNPVTLTVTDPSGNSSYCSTTVTVVDNTPPVVNCKPATINLDNNGKAILTTDMVNNGSSDVCGTVNLSLSKTNFDCSNLGSNSVTLSAKDASGNISTCTTTVTVKDVIAPTAICKPFTLTVNSSTGVGTLNPSDINNGSLDNCGITSMQLSKDGTNYYNSLSYSCSDEGTQTVYLKVIDASGNSSVCNTAIAVKPSLEIQSAYLEVCGFIFTSVVNGGSGNYSYYWETISHPSGGWFSNPKPLSCDFFTASYTATCKNPVLPLGGVLLPSGVYTIKLTVTDNNSGCKAVKTFSFNTNLFQSTISTNSSQECLGNTVTYTSSRYDGYLGLDYNFVWTFNGGTKISGGGNTNSITIQWNTVGDENNNNVSVQNKPLGNSGICVSVDQFKVTVNPKPTPLFQSPPPSTVCPNSTQIYNLQANSFASRTWSVTGGTIISGGTSGSNTATVQWGSGATGTISVTVANSTTAGGCTNTASKTVSIVDNAAPVITQCASDITVSADAGSCVATGVNLGTPPTATDNCGAVASITNNAPTSFPIGVTTVTWTATDYKGHTATCEQTVTVVDNQLPVIDCNQGNISRNTPNNSCSRDFAAPDPIYSDNCSVASLTWSLTGATTDNSPATGIYKLGTHSYNLGVTTVTYTVTDASGNSSSCSYKVTVKDNKFPTITAPEDVNVTTNSGCTATGVDLGMPTTGDNCTVVTVTNDAPTAFPIGETTVTWTVTDVSGNSATATQMVTVTDNTDPTLTVPDDIVTTSGVGACNRSVFTPNPVIVENCTVSTLTWEMTGATEASGTNSVGTHTFNQGETTVTYTVTDAAGNSATGSFTVTVNDEQDPVLTSCPATQPYYIHDDGQPYATLSFSAPTATDNCSVLPVTWTAPGASLSSGTGDISGVQFPSGATTVTYTATDTSGNSSICSFTVNVVGLPVINCPVNIISCDATQNISAPPVVSGTEPISFGWELSGATTGSGTGDIGSHTFNVGVTTIQWTASNIAGNATCSQTVMIEAQNTWLGVNHDWSDPVNWCPSVPDNSTDVVIPVVASGIYPNTSTSTATVHSLTIESGASVTVDGYKFQISGTISNNGTFDASNGTIEMAGSSAQTIPAGAFKDNKVKDLVINNSNSAGVTLAGAVDVYESLTFGSNGTSLNTGADGFLTLKSTADKTAYLGNMTGHTLTGDVTVERYIGIGTASGTHGKSWQFLATPTGADGNGQSLKESWMEGGSTTIAGYGAQFTGTAGHPGFDGIPSPGASVKFWDETTGNWTEKASATDPLYDIRGYFAFIRGDRTVDGRDKKDATPTKLRSKGTLAKGLQTFHVPASTNNHFYSIGNPYASAVDLMSVQVAPTIEESIIYVWNPSAGGNYGVGGWLTAIKSGDHYFATPGNKIVDTLESGQAFMVQTLDAPRDITINEQNKVSGSSNTYFREQTVKVPNLRTTLYSIDNDGSALISDGTLQQFDERYTNKINSYDARKIINGANNLSLQVSGINVIVERRAPLTEQDTIQYNMSSMAKQNYRLEFRAQGLSSENVEGFVEDTYLDTRTPLNMEGTTHVDFAVTSDKGSYAANRFRIVFKTAVVLPVKFVSITAVQKDEDIEVSWKTENEKAVKQYDVEKSVDGVSYKKAYTVAADNNGAGSYQWLDEQAIPGDNYYRIRMEDESGKISYSDVVKVSIPLGKPSIGIYPNPITDGIIHLQFVNQPKGRYGLRLLNPLGQTIIAKQVEHAGGNATENIKWDYNLAHGVYQLQVLKPDGKIQVIKVMY